jgi:hypothetical protein
MSQKKLDIPKQHIMNASGVGVFAEVTEVDEDDEEAGSMNSEDEAVILAEIAQMDLEESEVVNVLAAIDVQHKRTWKASQSVKKAIKRDRKFFDTSEDVTAAKKKNGNRFR